MSSDDRWAKATAAVERIEEVESARRDPVGAQADLAALRRAAVRVTGCDVDADPSVILAALGMLPSFEERVGIVRVLRDAAGGALSPEDTAAVLAVLSRSVPAGEAPRPATPPLAQALDLLRRVRSVLYNVGVVRSNVDAEVDALLAGTPVVGSRATEVLRSTLESLHGMMPDPAFDALHAAVRDVENASRPDAAPRAPLTEEEARIARGLQACAAAWEPDVRLIGNFTAREIGRFASAILSRGEIPPDVRAVAPFTEEEARRSLGATLREAAKQSAIYSPMCAVRAGADVGRVAPKVEEPMLTPAEEADVIAGAPAQIAPHGQSEIEILRAAVVRAHERIDALEKKPVEATIAAMAAQIERLDAEMRHVLVTIARDPKVEGDDVEAEEDPRTRLHEGDPEGKPSTLKERVSRVVLGTIDGEPVHVRATAKDKP